MQSLQRVRACVVLSVLSIGLYLAHVPAQMNADAAKPGTQETAKERDGQHDFDFDIGTWKVHMRRLLHPLTGSTTWVEYNGTDVVRKVWDGRANLGEVEVDGPAGHLELLTLRLYNPQAHQWSINITSSTTGTLSPPAIGEFKNGRGEFYDQETFNGRTILVRFGVSDITPNSCRFDQAFSADGGKTWEVNLIVTETLVKDEPKQAQMKVSQGAVHRHEPQEFHENLASRGQQCSARRPRPCNQLGLVSRKGSGCSV